MEDDILVQFAKFTGFRVSLDQSREEMVQKCMRERKVDRVQAERVIDRLVEDLTRPHFDRVLKRDG